MTARIPKLDPTWMAALGFTKIDEPERRDIQWRHEYLKCYVYDDALLSSVIATRDIALRRVVERECQYALREALLPAMGLTVNEEYTDGGYIKRSYVAPE